MKKWKLICLTVLCFSLLACSSTYERDTSEGTFEEIKYEEFTQKMKDKESFMMIASQTNCSHCKRYLADLTTYLKEHNITVYDINLATQSIDVYTMFENFEKDITKYGDKDIEPFKGTPYTMVVENGKIVDGYSGAFTYTEGENHEEWDYSMDEFDDIVKEYRLDAKRSNS